MFVLYYSPVTDICLYPIKGGAFSFIIPQKYIKFSHLFKDSMQIIFYEVEVWKKSFLFRRPLGNQSWNAGELILTRLGELSNIPSSSPVEETEQRYCS